jgi:mediator of RNA polymerase II transcription subunit 18
MRRANDGPQGPYQLRYIGNPELGDAKRATIVRACFDISCSPTIMEFLEAMGCRLEFEYNIRGYLFRKGRMKITVAKIFKMPAEAISNSYLVELSVLAPSGQDQIAEEMRIFAEKLKPLVHFEKIDYKRTT